jgi:hypothetical protein
VLKSISSRSITNPRAIAFRIRSPMSFVTAKYNIPICCRVMAMNNLGRLTPKVKSTFCIELKDLIR